MASKDGACIVVSCSSFQFKSLHRLGSCSERSRAPLNSHPSTHMPGSGKKSASAPPPAPPPPASCLSSSATRALSFSVRSTVATHSVTLAAKPVCGRGGWGAYAGVSAAHARFDLPCIHRRRRITVLPFQHSLQLEGNTVHGLPLCSALQHCNNKPYPRCRNGKQKSSGGSPGSTGMARSAMRLFTTQCIAAVAAAAAG